MPYMYCTNCGKHLTKKLKFCTHCGQKVNTTSKSEFKRNKGGKLRTPFFVLWVLTIFLFIISAGLIDPSRPNQIGKPPILPILFGVNFCLGIAAFLAVIVTELMNIKVSKKSFHRFIFALIIIFGLLYSSIVAIEGYAKGNLNNLLPSSLQNSKQSTTNKVEGSKASQVPLKSASDSTPITTPTPKPIINTNQLVNCGPGQYSGQYVKDKQSNCKNYVDCGFSNNVWTMMLKNECDKRQSETTTKNNINPYPTLTNYPPCVVYYPILGYSQTYSSTPPDLCQKWKDSAVSSSQIPTQAPIATPIPIPTVDNHAANSSCKYSASQWYNSQVSYYSITLGSQGAADSSAYTQIVNSLKSQYNSKISACDSQYPI